MADMIMEIVWIIEVSILLNFILGLGVFLSWRFFWTGIKLRLFKHSLLLVVRKDGSLELATAKNPEKVKLGKGIIKDETEIEGKFHFEQSSGKPAHVIIQGLEKSQNLLDLMAKQGISKLDSKLHSIANTIAYWTGVAEGESAEKAKTPVWMVILLMAIIVMIVVLIYINLQNQEQITTTVGLIQDAITQFQQTGGTVTITPGE